MGTLQGHNSSFDQGSYYAFPLNVVIYLHSLVILLGTPYFSYQFAPPFAFRTALILHVMDSRKVLETFLKDFGRY